MDRYDASVVNSQIFVHACVQKNRSKAHTHRSFRTFSDQYSAHRSILTLPMVSANFVMNATASKHLQANVLSQINNELKLSDLIQYSNHFAVFNSASTTATVTLINNVVKRNGKIYLVVTAVNAKLDIGYFSSHFYSAALNPIVTSLINKSVNTHWRSVYKDVQTEFEAYACDIHSIISSALANIAVEDFFLQ